MRVRKGKTQEIELYEPLRRPEAKVYERLKVITEEPHYICLGLEFKHKTATHYHTLVIRSSSPNVSLVNDYNLMFPVLVTSVGSKAGRKHDSEIIKAFEALFTRNFSGRITLIRLQ